MSKRINSWWKRVKVSRANLVLLAAGCLLLLMAPIWRFIAAPAIRVVAGDFDLLYFSEGTLTTYVNPPGSPAVPTDEPLERSVVLEERIFSRPDLSSGKVSAVQIDSRLYDFDTGDDIYVDQGIYTLDRKTGENVDAPGADRFRTGYNIVFPFNSPRSTVPFWNEQIQKVQDAGYVEDSTIEGVHTYRYSVSYRNQPMAAPPRGFEGDMTGGQLKEVLSRPELLVDDASPVEPEYTSTGEMELVVEPKMGTIISAGFAEAVSMTVSDPGGSFRETRLIYRMDCSRNQQSTMAAAKFAEDEVSKLRLQFLYIPLGFLALGLATLAVGAFAGIRWLGKVTEERGGSRGPPSSKGHEDNTYGESGAGEG